jgi:hypothetical protein
VALLWFVVYRRSRSVGIATVFAGLESALLLAFRMQAFWPKPDGLLLLVVSVGLVAVLRMKLPSQAVLGVCLGVAVGLKPHGAAYFLPILALAHQRGWRWQQFAGAAAAAVCVLAVPFLLLAPLFSLPRYVGILKMAVHEGFAFADLLRYAKWAGLLMALIVVSEQWQQPAERLSRAERRFRFRYRASIAVGWHWRRCRAPHTPPDLVI